jgi:hypothetical protein
MLGCSEQSVILWTAREAGCDYGGRRLKIYAFWRLTFEDGMALAALDWSAVWLKATGGLRMLD